MGTKSTSYPGLWVAALLTAMRLGELLALRWEEVDLERGTLAVRRTATRAADGRFTVGEPKGGRNRQVALAPEAIFALRRYRARQAERRLRLGSLWHDPGLVFDRGDGSGLTHQAVGERMRRRVARLGLLPIRFHDLRHSAATLLLEMGVPPEDRLGAARSRGHLDHDGPLQPRDGGDAPRGGGATRRAAPQAGRADRRRA